MSTYIRQLNEHKERERERERQAREAAAEAKRSVETRAARERLTPLEDRLARLLANLPAEVRGDGVALASLQVQLRGRWRGTAPSGHIGIALRRLGWTRKRCWRGEAGFSAKWYPPGGD